MAHLAVADRETLHHAIAVEPVPVAEIADLMHGGTVAIQAALQPRGQPAADLRFCAQLIGSNALEAKQPRVFFKTRGERALPLRRRLGQARSCARGGDRTGA